MRDSNDELLVAKGALSGLFNSPQERQEKLRGCGFKPKIKDGQHRFNNRKNEYIFRDTLAKLVNAAKLPYSELVEAA